MVCWPGIEGYNYPFQTPYAESWAWFVDGIAEAAETCAAKGVKLFLEHKNSEPAMKILMRNVGMTLHVIHTLRRRGITNVQVNMDWQHLLMNGESLAEYAALLASEGLLGHQHANSGWGTFDDDNMVGATAFMETLELAVELRRVGTGRTASGSASTSTRTRRTRSRRCGGASSSGASSAASRAGSTTPRCARRSRGRMRCAPTSSSTPRSAHSAACRLVGIDVGTTGVKALAVSPEGEVVARPTRATRSRRRAPAGPSRTPTTGGAARGGAPRVSAPARCRRHRSLRADARARRPRRDASVLRPAILWNDQRTGGRVRRDRGARRARAADRADRQQRADRVHRAEAPLAAPARARRLRADRARAAAEGLCPAAADRRARDRRRRRIRDAALRRRAPALGHELLDALELPAAGFRPCTSRPRSGGDAGGDPVAAGAGDQAAGALGVGARPAGPLSVVLGTSGVVFAALPAFAPDPEARVHAFCHAVPGAWQAMGVMLSAAGSLRWLREQLAPACSSPALIAEAEGWEPGAEGLLFLPYLAGERTPHADPDARGAFVGLSLRHDRGALVRAVLEGVAFGLRDSLELLRELGVAPTAAASRAAAPAADSGSRIVASALGLPLERDRSSRRAGVRRGAARRRRGRRLRRRPRGGRALRPRHRGRRARPCTWHAYAELQPRYRALYPALRGVDA